MNGPPVSGSNATEAEGAWQKLHETVGRSSSACLLAVMEMAGDA